MIPAPQRGVGRVAIRPRRRVPNGDRLLPSLSPSLCVSLLLLWPTLADAGPPDCAPRPRFPQVSGRLPCCGVRLSPPASTSFMVPRHPTQSRAVAAATTVIPRW
jgi:hypothetical protein